MKKSWIDVHPSSDFSIHNIPFSVCTTEDNEEKRVCTAIGDYIVDLAVLETAGLFVDITKVELFHEETVNRLIAQGKPVWAAIRTKIQSLLSDEASPLKNNKLLRENSLYLATDVTLHLPLKVGDYTDFYTSKNHAENVGSIFRGPENALMPNWTHMPIGYHGRASSIVVSGTDIVRPSGQIKPPTVEQPFFSPCKQLDYELEMGIIVGRENALGQPVSIEEAEDYLFGMVLLNDWSARDIQAFEYQPLGPFLAKNFATSISPWIVTMDALAQFKTAGIEREHELLPYLQQPTFTTYDINLSVDIKTPKLSKAETIAQTNYKYLYWSAEQMVAHHTVSGCSLKVGDLFGTGTVSGTEKSTRGCLLELTWRGTEPVQLSSGEERNWLEDGDEIVITGYCENNDIRIGFGQVSGKIEPAYKFKHQIEKMKV
jgi:fumarylacetoacetase